MEPSGTRLQPSPLLKLGIRLALPDLYATWIPFAIRALRRVLRPNTVVISTGPVSGHVVTRLVRDVQPWIADINDLWSGNPHWPAGRVRGAIDRRLERTTLRAATRITTVNDRMAAELRSRYGDLPVAVIRNGFDPAEFSADDAATGDGPAQLVFAGTLYPDFDLSPLFQAVAEGQRAGRLTPDRLLLAFVGWGTQRAALVARRFGVDEFVESYGAVPRAELLIRLRRATALLLPLYERDPYSLPSRLFEYIGAARPVIALGPTGGVAAELVRNEGIGVIVTTSDEAASILDELIAAPDGLPHADAETRATFTWDASIRYLAELVATVGELPRAPITGGET